MSHIAIITVGNRGIGAATARLAAEAGYDVCINYANDAEAARQVVVACKSNGGRAIAMQADVARLFRECDEKLGPVSLLANNARIISQATTVADLTDDTLARTFAVNVYRSIYCAWEAVRRMAKSAGGSGGVIVNVSSVAAQLGSPARAPSPPAAPAPRAAPWRPPDDGRTEVQRLRSLLEHGVGASFDLRGWCTRDCCALGARERLGALLEQCRPEVAKLIVMETLEAVEAALGPRTQRIQGADTVVATTGGLREPEGGTRHGPLLTAAAELTLSAVVPPSV